MSRYILALDQGTTSSRAILFDRSGNIIQMAQQEFTQHYPQPGWVEHNPNELFDSQSTVAARCLRQAGITGSEVAAVGITKGIKMTMYLFYFTYYYKNIFNNTSKNTQKIKSCKNFYWPSLEQNSLSDKERTSVQKFSRL